MDKQEKISLLHAWIGCFHPLTYWVFDPAQELTSCSSPDSSLLLTHLITEKGMRQLLTDTARATRPVLRVTPLQTAWLAASEKDAETVARFHVFGPFFQDNASRQQCSEQFSRLSLPASVSELVWRTFQAVPLIFSSDFTRYSILLHYILTGERRKNEEFTPQALGAPQSSDWLQKEQADAMVWQHAVEMKMIHMIREGNLDYGRYIQDIMMRRNGPGAYSQETLRQTKNRTYARAGLVAEAAIQGGVEVENALSMLYYHLQCMEDAGNIHELGRACRQMEEEFAGQVYRRRTAQLSRAVLDCCDYIQLHLEDENLSRAQLAKALNYSEGYLSRKFRQEMGMTIKDYMIRQRLERGKELLRSTKMSIQDISLRLCFGSPSHFAAAFRKAWGMSPGQWRETAGQTEKPDRA